MSRTKLCKKDLPTLREMLQRYEDGRPASCCSGMCHVLGSVDASWSDDHIFRRIENKIRELPGYVGGFYIQPLPWTEAGRKKRIRILKKWIEEAEEA